MSDRPFDLQHALVQQLESLHRAGVRQLAKIEISPDDIAALSLSQAESGPSENIVSTPENIDTRETTVASERRTAAQAAPEVGDQIAELDILQQQVAACTRCAELASTRTQTVFGVGNPNARVVFFGEAPGADEDRQGEPFVGRAGQLLTKIITACTWNRDDVYILNTLKCRPPGNRNPDVDELSNCRGYWQRQLEIIQPDYIICLGKFAMQELLETAPSQAIGRMRHEFHDYSTENVNAKVVVTYHPSYLLRNPAAKKEVWQDMKMLLADMGIDP